MNAKEMTMRELKALVQVLPKDGEDMAIYYSNHAVWHSEMAVRHANRAVIAIQIAIALQVIAVICLIIGGCSTAIPPVRSNPHATKSNETFSFSPSK